MQSLKRLTVAKKSSLHTIKTVMTGHSSTTDVIIVHSSKQLCLKLNSIRENTNIKMGSTVTQSLTLMTFIASKKSLH